MHDGHETHTDRSEELARWPNGTCGCDRRNNPWPSRELLCVSFLRRGRADLRCVSSLRRGHANLPREPSLPVTRALTPHRMRSALPPTRDHLHKRIRRLPIAYQDAAHPSPGACGRGAPLSGAQVHVSGTSLSLSLSTPLSAGTTLNVGAGAAERAERLGKATKATDSGLTGLG